MSLFPKKCLLKKLRHETWKGFVDKLPSDHDKAVFTKMLNDCYKYAVAINNQVQEHPFTTESLIISLLLSQHKLINHLKSIIKSRQTDNTSDQREYF